MPDMRLQHRKSVQPPGKLKQNGRFPRITAICWSPNNIKFAISNSDRNIIIYDGDGAQRDRFATKCADPNSGSKNYQVCAIAFSADSTKLAVAQTDHIVYVYRLGDNAAAFGEKKSICNKLAVSAAVTCMCWPIARSDMLLFGVANGALKIGILKLSGVRKNKCATLMDSASFAHAITSNASASYFYSIHANQCVYRCSLPDVDGTPATTAQPGVLLAQLSFVPNTIVVGHGDAHVIVSSVNGAVQVLDAHTGAVQQHFECGEQHLPSPYILCAAMHPCGGGHTVVYGGLDCFFVFAYQQQQQQQWQPSAIYRIENVGCVSCVHWSGDGATLSVASMTGTVDFYDACVKRIRYGDRFSVVYAALDAAVVHNRFTDEKLAVRSQLGVELELVEIVDHRFVAMATEQSLIVADMQSAQLQSEISWHAITGNGRARFNFETPGFALIFYASELLIVEFGRDEIVHSCRTEFDCAHLVSMRMNGAQNMLAYLLDAQSICVMDLAENVEVDTVTHDAAIEWLELNENGSALLFMDRSRALHLYHVRGERQKSATLLSFCDYAQWVPDSSQVMVAQNRRSLCVWYDMRRPSQVTVVEINGDVEGIERVDDVTSVLVRERDRGGAPDVVRYTLNETLITFGAALEQQHDYGAAVNKLERLCAASTSASSSSSSQSELQSMWTQLSEIALHNRDVGTAQRCCTALGDVCRAQYLADVAAGDGDDDDQVEHEAKLAILKKQFKRAESLYIAHGRIDDAILCHLQLNRWSDAMKLCKLRKHPMLAQIEECYFAYLLRTQQAHAAANWKCERGDFLGAAQLYVDHGFAAAALKLLMSQQQQQQGIVLQREDALVRDMLRVLTQQHGDYEHAGVLLQHVGDVGGAFDTYLGGHCFAHALALAKTHNAEFGDRVTEIETRWARHLCDRREYEGALAHFIEAGQYADAIECAIECQQFGKAVEILHATTASSSDDDERRRLCRLYTRIAEHFENTRKFDLAEEMYIKADAGVPRAVVMHVNAGHSRRATQLCAQYDTRVYEVVMAESARMELCGEIESAANLLVRADAIDDAVALLQKHRRFEQLMEMVATSAATTKYSPAKLRAIHTAIATAMKESGDLVAAETYFLKNADWKAVCAMYRERDMMDDALRVCGAHGGTAALQQMVFEVGAACGDDEKALALMTTHAAFEKAVEYAVQRALFERAFEIARAHCSDETVAAVHYRLALRLEQSGEFARAEHEFVAAGKSKEAIEMYIHEKRWSDAQRIALAAVDVEEPTLLAQVYRAHGMACLEENDLRAAEQWYVEGDAADDAIEMYRERGMMDDALRVAQMHHRTAAAHSLLEQQPHESSFESIREIMREADAHQQNGSYERAVQVLLSARYPQHSETRSEVVSAWEHALHICSEKALHSLPSNIASVAKQLVAIDEFEKAAQFYLEMNEHRAAIDTFVAGNMFEQAKRVCSACAHTMDGNENEALMRVIEQKYDAYNNEDDAVDDGVDDMAKHSSLQQSQQLYKQELYIEAVTVLCDNKNAVPESFENISFYLDLVSMVLHEINRSDVKLLIDAKAALPVVKKMKHFVHFILSWLPKKTSPQQQQQHRNACCKFLDLFHLLFVKNQCDANDNALNTLFHKQCIALLSYNDWLRCDVLFENAGRSCKTVAKHLDAFIYFNHFVDICDHIDDADNDIDYADFAKCRHVSVPHKQIPSTHIYGDKHREQIRDWVLEMLATSEINPTLSDHHQLHCGADQTRQQYIAKCIVTGTPLYVSDTAVQCRACKRYADKTSWNLYIDYFKICPWCQQAQAPIY